MRANAGLLREELVGRTGREFLCFLLFSVVCLGLLGARIYMLRRAYFAFLVWNLLLAWIPYWLSCAMWFIARARLSRWWLLGLGLVWLLFFPNAPYLLTDFMHLKPRGRIPFWFDLAMLSAFSLHGLLLGLHSLRMVHALLEDILSPWGAWLSVAAVLFLSSFGIYLGRFLRWNSWDLLQAPNALFSDIFQRLLYPTAYPRTYGVTLVFFLLFLCCYLLLVPGPRERVAQGAASGTK